MEQQNPICIKKNEKFFSLKSNKNHLFAVNFKSFPSFIKIESSYKDSVSKHEYKKKFFYEELKLNKYLSICDSVSEIYEQIISDINEKNINIIEKTNLISIIIPVQHLKVKEICFDVPEIIKNDDKKMDGLIAEVNDLKKVIKGINESSNKKIKYLENENVNLKEKIGSIEKNFSILLNKYISMEKVISKIIDKIKKNNNNNNSNKCNNNNNINNNIFNNNNNSNNITNNNLNKNNNNNNCNNYNNNNNINNNYSNKFNNSNNYNNNNN